MPNNNLARVALILGLVIAIALVAMYVPSWVSFPRTGFVPPSFITHSIMLIATLLLVWLMSGATRARFGLTMGTYRFKPTILFWVLPTAALSTFAVIAGGGEEGPSMLAGWAKIKTILFVWIYASVCEEVLTRGLLQTLLTGDRALGERCSRFGMPIVLSALVFGAMHLVLVKSMGPAALMPIVFATLLGYLAARYRDASGSLVPAIIVHALFNVGGMLPGWIAEWITV